MSKLSEYRESRDLAHIVPFATFMLFMLLPGLLISAGFTSDRDGMPWFRTAPEQWIYPIQTIATLVVLWFFRKHYEFHSRGLAFGMLMGVVGIALWIAPGYLFRSLEMPPGWYRYLGFADRPEGFDPSFIRSHSPFWYGTAIGFRFLRMVVAVALVEEIFWRGFLMRYFVDPDGDYWEVPFGTFHRVSFVAVTACVTIVHSPTDYAAAAVYGMLAYYVAVRTKNLLACVTMHAVANLLLGVYIMSTEQWGYW